MSSQAPRGPATSPPRSRSHNPFSIRRTAVACLLSRGKRSCRCGLVQNTMKEGKTHARATVRQPLTPSSPGKSPRQLLPRPPAEETRPKTLCLDLPFSVHASLDPSAYTHIYIFRGIHCARRRKRRRYFPYAPRLYQTTELLSSAQYQRGYIISSVYSRVASALTVTIMPRGCGQRHSARTCVDCDFYRPSLKSRHLRLIPFLEYTLSYFG